MYLSDEVLGDVAGINVVVGRVVTTALAVLMEVQKTKRPTTGVGVKINIMAMGGCVLGEINLFTLSAVHSSSYNDITLNVSKGNNIVLTRIFYTTECHRVSPSRVLYVSSRPPSLVQCLLYSAPVL